MAAEDGDVRESERSAGQKETAPDAPPLSARGEVTCHP